VRFFDELESRRTKARMNSPPIIDIRCSETTVAFDEFKLSSNPLDYCSQEKNLFCEVTFIFVQKQYLNHFLLFFKQRPKLSCFRTNLRLSLLYLTQALFTQRLQ
jgi:hypothetical protein